MSNQWAHSLTKKGMFYFLTVVFTSTSFAQKNASKDPFVSLREYKAQSKWDAFNKEIEKNEKELKEFDLIYLNQFLKAEAIFIQGDMDKAIEFFSLIKNQKGPLTDYAESYLAQAYLKKTKIKEAQSVLETLVNSRSNSKIRTESALSLVRIYNDKRESKKAFPLIRKLERESRFESYYADIVYEFARTQKYLHNHAQFCKWSAKLYEKFPLYPLVTDWGFELSKNLFEGKPTGCQATNDEQKNRIRNLQWLGLGETAKVEVQKLEATMGGEKSYEAIKLHAQYMIYDGQIVEALKMLEPFLELKKRDFNFLMMVGGAHLRIGDGVKASDYFYRAYLLNPRYKQAKESLFQSALVAFQFQNYDDSEKKFMEFKSKYKSSSLVKDVDWKLAWLQYVRGNYDTAYKQFVEFKQKYASGRKRKRIAKEAIYYWIAMSLYKQNKFEKAKEGFLALSQDKLHGYYSILASQRLQQVEEKIPKNNLNLAKPRDKVYTRFTATEMMISSVDGFGGDVISQDDEDFNFEEEDTEVADEEVEEGVPPVIPATPTASNVTAEEETAVPETLPEAPTFKNPELLSRFEKARYLMMIGHNDFAKWELFDIERRTKDKEYLRQLVAEYERIDSFNRSAYISQVSLGPQRVKYGFEAGKSLWQSCYPKAYQEHVEKSSQKLGVNPFLIWSIMRAESTYKNEIRSPVGALGLMQVMPVTGKKVAERAGIKNFHADDLLVPEKAIFIGANYLQKLSKEFDANIALVAAAYNAGPHRAMAWLKSFGQLDMDEYVEHIPFLETRNYVKKVVTNYHIYNRLYTSGKDEIKFMVQPSRVKLPGEIPTRETWDNI